MRPLLLSTTLLALLLLGSAHAGEEPRPLNYTLTCSIASGGAVGCFIERPVFVLDSLEIGIGVDTQAAIWGDGRTYVSGYVIAGWYEPTWNAWAELAIPEVFPVIGRPTAFRAGFSIRF